MKPNPFEYRRPDGIDEALAALALSDVKVLAGGQSLVPILNLRLAAPAALVDINTLPGLDEISIGTGEIRLGALVRHSQVEDSAELRQALPLLPRIAAGIAFRGIRTRGTICGSIAHADPSAEWPLVLLAMDGVVEARSVAGGRRISADHLFTGFLETSLTPGELIVETVRP